MSGFTPSNGSKLFIGPAVDIDTVDTAAEFAALSYTEIKGVKDLGAFGDESAAITSNQLGADRTFKQKGTRDAGTPGFVVDIKESDPGQQAAIAAEADGGDYAFYIATPARGTTPARRRYFAGLVMSCRESFGAANNPITMTISVGINTPIFRVAAT